MSIKVVKIIHCAGRTHEENHHFVCWAFLDIWHCCWFWSSLWNRMWIVKFLILIWWLEVGLRYKYMCLAHSTWDSFLWFYGCYTLQSNDFWVEKHLVKSTGGHFYSKRWKIFFKNFRCSLNDIFEQFSKNNFPYSCSISIWKKISKVLPNNDQIVWEILKLSIFLHIIGWKFPTVYSYTSLFYSFDSWNYRLFQRIFFGEKRGGRDYPMKHWNTLQNTLRFKRSFNYTMACQFQ